MEEMRIPKVEFCWLGGNCNMEEDSAENCTIHCPMYIQLKHLFDGSELPKYLQIQNKELKVTNMANKASFKTLIEYNKNVREHIENPLKGQDLYIWSRNKGTGKTSWAGKIMKNYFAQIAWDNDLEPKGLFVNVSKLFTDLRRSFDDKDLALKMQQKMDYMMEIPLLVLDDIGAENGTDWVKEQLYIIINERYNNMLTTIYTSNLSIRELADEKHIGERSADRIKGRAINVELVGNSMRGADS